MVEEERTGERSDDTGVLITMVSGRSRVEYRDKKAITIERTLTSHM